MTETLNPVKSYQQFIGGQWVDAASGETLDVENPATGEVVATVPASSRRTSIARSRPRRPPSRSWSLTTPQTRSLALLKIADIIDDNADELGRLESSQTGKPTGAAIDEMTTSSDLFRFFAGACRVMEGLAVTEYLEGHTSMVRRDPVGVVASIAPWNYPLYMAAWKLGPALATGNTVVLKPSARTPLSALRFAELVAGELPAGRPQRAVGLGRRDRRPARRAPEGPDGLDHRRHRRPASTSRRSRPGTVKRLHLELGGKAPVIVFDDADVELAAEIIKSAGYWNSGQDCTAACRVIAGPAVYDKFVAALSDQVKSIKWGNPADADDLDMGSLIAQAQADKVEGMVDRALEAKAELVVGGTPPRPPRRLLRADDHRQPRPGIARSSRTRSSGRSSPSSASRTRSRRSSGRTTSSSASRSSVFTGSIGKAMRVARRLQFGTVWINEHFTLASETPHGGVKESGYGKDGSKYALEDYTTVKHITINTGI